MKELRTVWSSSCYNAKRWENGINAKRWKTSIGAKQPASTQSVGRLASARWGIVVVLVGRKIWWLIEEAGKKQALVQRSSILRMQQYIVSMFCGFEQPRDCSLQSGSTEKVISLPALANNGFRTNNASGYHVCTSTVIRP